MKKLCFLPVLCCLLLLTACAPPTHNGENPAFERKTTAPSNDYVSTLWEGREYVPYCNGLSAEDLGDYLGCDASDSAVEYYALKGYPPEEYVVEYLRSGLCDSPCLLREISAPSLTVYPPEEGYDWNPGAEGREAP